MMSKDFIQNFLTPAVTAVFVIGIYMIFPSHFEGKILGMYMFNATRLVLLLFIFFSLFFYFTDGLKYKGNVQKIFFRGTILSLLFTIFTSAGFFIVYLKNPQEEMENYSLLKSWFVQFTQFLKYGMLYTVLSLVWIYFHPQNLTKRRKKTPKHSK
ncbi:MAG: hypothetical protein ACJA0Q_000974 [Saprospiraceae bacterium]|jgi:hypothetical protein